MALWVESLDADSDNSTVLPCSVFKVPSDVLGVARDTSSTYFRSKVRFLVFPESSDILESQSSTLPTPDLACRYASQGHDQHVNMLVRTHHHYPWAGSFDPVRWVRRGSCPHPRGATVLMSLCSVRSNGVTLDRNRRASFRSDSGGSASKGHSATWTWCGRWFRNRWRGAGSPSPAALTLLSAFCNW